MQKHSKDNFYELISEKSGIWIFEYIWSYPDPFIFNIIPITFRFQTEAVKSEVFVIKLYNSNWCEIIVGLLMPKNIRADYSSLYGLSTRTRLQLQSRRVENRKHNDRLLVHISDVHEVHATPEHDWDFVVITWMKVRWQVHTYGCVWVCVGASQLVHSQRISFQCISVNLAQSWKTGPMNSVVKLSSAYCWIFCRSWKKPILSLNLEGRNRMEKNCSVMTVRSI